MDTSDSPGTAEILEAVRTDVVEKMRLRLLERRAQGRSDLSEDEIETLARIAGTLAKQAATSGMVRAFQLGRNGEAEVGLPSLRQVTKTWLK